MSSASILTPTPPPELYPQLKLDFWMQKINKISAALNNEVSHYQAVAKKYKRAKTFVNWGAAGSSTLSAVFFWHKLWLSSVYCLPACHLAVLAGVSLSLCLA